MAPEEKKTAAASKAVQNYVVQTKKWPIDTFTVVLKRREANTAVFWAIHKDDQRAKEPGGGKSVELHVDMIELKILRELHFQ